MEALESTSQSFIVKVWVEESAEEASQNAWRGHITHVASGERRYLKSLDEIRDFITPHLKKMGVKIERSKGVRRRLRQLIGKI